MAEAHFDSCCSVEDALVSSRTGRAGRSPGSVPPPRLTVVCYADPWAPPAMATAAAMETVRMGGEVAAIANLFNINASEEHENASVLGVTSTPALFFYLDGEPMLVRRPGWEDDRKYRGALVAAQLLEIIRHARSLCGGDGSSEPAVLSLDF